MPRGEGRDFEFRDVSEMNPFAVQPSYVPAPVASPLAVQPSYAPMGGDYDLSPEVLAQLANLGVNPYGGGQSPMANPVSSPLAVRGMPEMDPNEVSPLAVQGPVDAQPSYAPGSLDDLSQFGGLGGLDGYEANSSGAPQGMPTSYAFPENYGNPKNKIYNLTAGPEDSIRLKFVDGTTMFEGKGPEAAAKAAAIVQELGKKFNTQSTWILDKQTAGGDWKQVSQDTVGTKKKTALNSFLDVVAPIAGSFLALVPGVGPALVGALGSAGTAAVGAGVGSLANSGLQNQNSAEAFKKAALAAAGTFVGAKLGEIVKGGTGVAGGATKSLQANMTDLQSALVDGLTDEQSILGMAGFGRSAAEISKIIGISQDVVSSIISNANPSAIANAAAAVAANAGSAAAADLTITALATNTGTGALTSAVTGGLGSAVTGGLTAGTSGVTNTATNTTAETQSGLDAANDAAVNDVQVTGTGTPVDTNVGYEIAGGLGGTGLTSGVNPVTVNPEPLTITAEPTPVDQTLAVPVPVPAPATTPAVNPDFVAKPEELVIEANEPPPTNEPVTPTPVVTPEPAINPDFVAKPNDAELKIEAEKKPVEEPVTPTPVVTPEPAINPDFVAKPEEVVIKAEKKPVEEPLKPTTTTGPLTTTQPTTPTNPVPDETVIKAEKKPVEEPLKPTPVVTPTQPTTPVNPVPETIEVPMPKKEEKVILPDGTLNPKFVDTPAPVVPPTAPPTAEPLPKTTTKFDPKTLLPLVPLVTGLVDGGDGGGGGGSGTNTLTYPGGTQPGTPGSLTDIFRTKLPTAPSSFSVTPRDMGKRDWLRYGFGPEASFFSNVPDRQAPLAVQKPTIAAMPALSEKLNEPTPNLMVKPDTQAASVPADGTMLNGNPSIVWNGGVNGGWMQTERGMPPPEEIATQAAFARGGSTGGTSRKPRTEFAVHGAGTGRSDDIPAVLSDGEYVMDAETVALLGDGSSKAGAEKLDQLRVNLRRHKGANLAKGRFSVNAKSPEKYLAGGRV